MFGVATDVGMQAGMKKWQAWKLSIPVQDICQIHLTPSPPHSISLWPNTWDHSEIPVLFNVSKVLFSFQKWCSSGWTCIMAALKCSSGCEYGPCWPQQKKCIAPSVITLLCYLFSSFTCSTTMNSMCKLIHSFSLQLVQVSARATFWLVRVGKLSEQNILKTGSLIFFLLHPFVPVSTILFRSAMLVWSHVCMLTITWSNPNVVIC